MADVFRIVGLLSSLLGPLAGIFTAGAIEHQVRDAVEYAAKIENLSALRGAGAQTRPLNLIAPGRQ
jgi:hypothetical protein